MPSLNFKARFAARVTAGSKPHTIRAWRKRPFRAGDNLSFFTGMRTKDCRRLRPNAPCTAAIPLQLNVARRGVTLAGRVLTPREIESLAHRDGFANVDEFWEFFSATHGRSLRGQLVQWQP
jgi:hypothetical protein